MDLLLQDKTALVIGGSRGLGYATAHLLSAEGAHVVINSRTEKDLAAAAGRISGETRRPVLPVPGDITDPLFPERLVKKTVQQFGGLDIVVANAGGPKPGLFENLDDSDWYQAVELSLMSQVRLIRAALPWLVKSKHASVLAITSVSVKQPLPNMILSNSIRAATVGMIKSLALELGDKGIRFNSIMPGWTETERVQFLLSNRAEINKTSFEDEYRKQASESLFGRLAKPEEFAAAAVFLVSPVASYLTGVSLSVDGGSYKGIF